MIPVMMSWLRTICLEIRRSVKHRRLATYETVWKVRLHRSNPFHLFDNLMRFILGSIVWLDSTPKMSSSLNTSSFDIVRGPGACGAQFESCREPGEEERLCNQRGKTATAKQTQCYNAILLHVLIFFSKSIFEIMVHIFLMPFSDQCPADQSASSHGG